jgi:hypothetical protein
VLGLTARLSLCYGWEMNLRQEIALGAALAAGALLACLASYEIDPASQGTAGGSGNDAGGSGMAGGSELDADAGEPGPAGAAGASVCSNGTTDAAAFSFTEVSDSSLPEWIRGWQAAMCLPPLLYTCPAGYSGADCVFGENGSHGGCSDCTMVEVTCKCQ